ncbi:MAG TPA: YibE/F family protein [Bacillota bacterium]|nr:YibE/F family protein [Bacillota bacterium]
MALNIDLSEMRARNVNGTVIVSAIGMPAAYLYMRKFKKLHIGITGLAIVWVLLPVLLKGYDPIYVTILVSAAITVVTLGIVGGFNRKTLTAILGTTSGVIIAGLIAMIVGSAARFSGFGA